MTTFLTLGLLSGIKSYLGSGSGSGSVSESGSGSIITDADPRIRIKMIRIRNTGFFKVKIMEISFILALSFKGYRGGSFDNYIYSPFNLNIKYFFPSF